MNIDPRLESKGYFFGTFCTRLENIVRESIDGSFLVCIREINNVSLDENAQKGYLLLFTKLGGVLLGIRIQYDAENSIYSISGGPLHKSMDDLISYYSNNELFRGHSLCNPLDNIKYGIVSFDKKSNSRTGNFFDKLKKSFSSAKISSILKDEQDSFVKNPYVNNNFAVTERKTSYSSLTERASVDINQKHIINDENKSQNGELFSTTTITTTTITINDDNKSQNNEPLFSICDETKYQNNESVFTINNENKSQNGELIFTTTTINGENKSQNGEPFSITTTTTINDENKSQNDEIRFSTITDKKSVNHEKLSHNIVFCDKYRMNQFQLNKVIEYFWILLSKNQEFKQFISGSCWIENNQNVANGMTKNEIELQEFMYELIITEIHFIKYMIITKNHFIKNFTKDNIVKDDLLLRIFSNFDQVLLICLYFCMHLLRIERNQNNTLDAFKLLQVFKRYFYCHRIFSFFCANHSTAVKLITNLKESSKVFCQLLLKLEDDPICNRMKLSDLLSMPMQRLTKYPLFIKSIIKIITTKNENEFLEYSDEQIEIMLYSSKEVKRTIDFVNDRVKWISNITRLRAIQDSMVYDSKSIGSVDLLNVKRYLLQEGYLILEASHSHGKIGNLFDQSPSKKKKCVEQERVYVLLFSDMFIFCSNEDDKLRVLMKPVTLEDIIVKDVASATSVSVGNKTSFYLISAQDHGSCIYMLSASSNADKTSWLTSIDKAISDFKALTKGRDAATRVFSKLPLCENDSIFERRYTHTQTH